MDSLQIFTIKKNRKKPLKKQKKKVIDLRYNIPIIVSFSNQQIILKIQHEAYWNNFHCHLDFMVNSIIGVTVLLLGLLWFGNDGKVMTYAAMVLACASTQWLLTL